MNNATRLLSVAALLLLVALFADCTEIQIITFANLKQCSIRNLNFEKEGGERVAMTCDFDKKRDDSVLRVAFNGALRLINIGTGPGSCQRWYFTLNDKECEPMTIDTQINVNDNNLNRHDPHHVEGYCRGVPTGRVVVKWNVGACVVWGAADSSGDQCTGWGSTSRIIIEEVDVVNAGATIV